MTIEDRLIEFRNARSKDSFVLYFTEHPKEIPELLRQVTELAPYPLKEYTSWILIHLAKQKPELIKAYYRPLVDLCFRTEDQTVLRNVTCCLNELGIEPYRDMEFIDLLIGFIQDARNKVALQVYSIYLLIQYAKKYPELTEEFRHTIDFNARNKTTFYTVAQRNFHRTLPKK